MPLNLTTGGGDFTPFLKYNAKMGQWSVRGEQDQPDVVIDKPRLAMDMANVKTGWILTSPGAPPQTWWDAPNGTRQALPNGVRAKDGFEVAVYGPDKQPNLGGAALGFRTWMANANAVKEGFCTAHTEWEQQSVDHPNEVPIFTANAVQRIPGAHGDNFAPVFELTGWVERSKIPAFDEHKAAQGNGAMTNGAPATDWQAPDDRPDVPATGPVDDLDDEIPF